jgi:hypothetical protein
VTVISFPISIGVISTEIVTALGATFRVEPAIGDVATSELASAGPVAITEMTIAPISAAKRFTCVPAFAARVVSIRLYSLTSLD